MFHYDLCKEQDVFTNHIYAPVLDSKFLRRPSLSNSKVRRLKIKVTIEVVSLGTHVKYEILITNHSRDMTNFKVFAERRMDRPKNICSRSFDMGA
jgi:hypothetical protein